MRKKINLALITIGIVIAGVVLVTGIARFNNRNKTEVKDNQTSTSISEQVEQTPESATSAESNIEIIEDETSISDDGVVTDKPEPYPDEYSLITQPEDNENNAESGDIKDVGNSINIVDETEQTGLPDSVKTELPELTDKDMDEFMKMVEDAGSPNIH